MDIIPIRYSREEAAMEVGYRCKVGARLRLIVWRGYLGRSRELIQPSVIVVCAGGSSPSAASALRFFFVALLIAEGEQSPFSEVWWTLTLTLRALHCRQPFLEL